jgi:hypothetical protein
MADMQVAIGIRGTVVKGKGVTGRSFSALPGIEVIGA